MTMTNEEFDALQLRVMICPQQASWPRPPTLFGKLISRKMHFATVTSAEDEDGVVTAL
jgi:hypothetical protein